MDYNIFWKKENPSVLPSSQWPQNDSLLLLTVVTKEIPGLLKEFFLNASQFNKIDNPELLIQIFSMTPNKLSLVLILHNHIINHDLFIKRPL